MKNIIKKLVFTGVVIRYRKKFKSGIQQFANGVREEATETREASVYVKKYMGGEKLTKEENEAVRKQFYDIIKMIGIGVPFALVPGGSILMPIIIKLAKRHNIKLMPSSFDRDEKKFIQD